MNVESLISRIQIILWLNERNVWQCNWQILDSDDFCAINLRVILNNVCSQADKDSKHLFEKHVTALCTKAAISRYKGGSLT